MTDTAEKTREHPAEARKRAIAEAKALAPDIAARIGSTPETKFRGDPEIFGRLVADHDKHRALMAMIEETSGDSPERRKLFEEMVKEMDSHASAEEQALWSTVLRNPATTADARHAVHEHKQIDDLIDELREADMASSGWLQRFGKLKEKYLHHIMEEEQEQFVAAEKELTEQDREHMRKVFERRKREEKASVEV
ncbi:MAG: hemerythrin domain-containing protein [Erythrobacter sp.]